MKKKMIAIILLIGITVSVLIGLSTSVSADFDCADYPDPVKPAYCPD